MSKKLIDKSRRLEKRKARIRKKINGSAERPRVSIFLSNQKITAQVIDDESGKTLAAASSSEEGKGKNRAAAVWVGATVAERAMTNGVKSVVFDRNGRLYHGRVKDLAEAMREKGLKL